MRKILVMALALSGALLIAQEFKVGSPIADFQVRDLDGRALSFSALKGPITVVTFIATQCPVSTPTTNGRNRLSREQRIQSQAHPLRPHARDVHIVVDGAVIAKHSELSIT